MLDSLSPSKGAHQWLRSLQSRKNFISAPVWAALTPWQWALQELTGRRGWVVGSVFTVLFPPWSAEAEAHLLSGPDPKLIHGELDDRGRSDAVPVAAAKQIVFLGLFLYTLTKKVTGPTEMMSLARNKWFTSAAECFTGSHFSFVLVLFYWWNNDSEACPASSLRCLCSLVAVWFSEQWQLLGSFMMDPFLTQRFVDGAACLLDFCKRLWIIFFFFNLILY